MKTAIEVLDAFERIRRAQQAGVYAPHKPLLILLALARVQRGEPRMVEFTTIDRACHARSVTPTTRVSRQRNATPIVSARTYL